ncbi:glycoside hydrolase family 73 protein [Metaclostridioides mangenotii]|uniref:Flagellum-specific peptidoglycan hydrolase FlgJ n=1 Tax=Metaclostridioides mangenotii TaxID=1540 RepID=A0ABS4ECZ1_9FIRM|nr:glucosaminidase domain-containing protein [Clostridioides mangenotii]MBP1855799.1 flagellum-specific peptidoglycan hydrolase FlgJ [Clostridioides mangenotii]
MPNKTEKSIKKNKRRNSRFKRGMKKIFITITTVLSIIVLFNVTKTLEDLFGSKDIENAKVEYYVNIADKVSDGKAQVSWKDLLAIESVKNDGDLSEVRKNDSLKIGERFLIKDKDEEGKTIYKVKKLDNVLNELNFTEVQKEEVHQNISDLEYVFLGKKLDKNDYRVLFIKQMEDAAVENYYEYGILPSITISQAILESGWGNSVLTEKSNNLFGIKADKRWNGDKFGIETTENYNDKIVANFRSYSSLKDSVRDYGKFLTENSRYTKHGLFESKLYTDQAQSLEDAGYSTKINERGEKIYADMLIEVIKNYNLQIIDNKVMEEE